MRRLTAVWPTLLALCLAMYSGCCCGPGYVFHGTWSLGLMRPPKSADSCSTGCDCPAQCTCPGQGNCPGQSGCPGQAGCPGQDRCPIHGGGPGQAGGSTASAGGPDGAGGKHCSRGARLAKRATAAQGATGPDQGHPRFHPVPVRPVFGPSAGPLVVPVVAPVPELEPEMENPVQYELEEVPLPRPAAVPNNARRPAVRRASLQTTSEIKFRELD